MKLLAAVRSLCAVTTHRGLPGLLALAFLGAVSTASGQLQEDFDFDYVWGGGGAPALMEWTDTEPGVNPVTGWFVDLIATTLFPQFDDETASLPGGELDLDGTIQIEGFVVGRTGIFNLRGQLTLLDFMAVDGGEINFFNNGQLRLTDLNNFIANGGTFLGDDGTASIRGNFTNGFFESDPLSPPNPGLVLADGGNLFFNENGRTFLNTIAGTVRAVGNSRVSFQSQRVVLDGGDTTGDGTLEVTGNSTVVYRSGNVLNPLELRAGILDLGNANAPSGQTARFIANAAPGPFRVDVSGDIPDGVALSIVDGSTLFVPEPFENSGDLTFAGPQGSALQTRFSTGGTFTNSGQLTFRNADVNETNKHRILKDLVNAPTGMIRVTDASNPRLNVVLNNGSFDIEAGTRVDSSTSFRHTGGTLNVDGELFALGAGLLEWSGGNLTATTGLPTLAFTGFRSFPGQSIIVGAGQTAPVRLLMIEPGEGLLNYDDDELSAGQVLEIQNDNTNRRIRMNDDFVNRGTIFTNGDSSVRFEPGGTTMTNFGLMDLSGLPGSTQAQREVADIVNFTNHNELVLKNSLLLLSRFAGSNYIQPETGSLSIELRGTGAGQFDRVQASGGAQIAGTVKLKVASSYAPSLGDTVSILQTNFAPNFDVSGEFTTVEGVSLGTVNGFDASLAVTYRLDFVDVTVAKTGDLNLDTTVDATDLLALGGNFRADGSWATGDVNGDGFVDEADLDLIAANFTGGAISRAQAASLAGITAAPLLIFEIEFVDVAGVPTFEVRMDAGRESTLGDAQFTDDLTQSFRAFTVFGGTKSSGMLGVEPIVRYRFPLSSNDQLFARPPPPAP